MDDAAYPSPRILKAGQEHRFPFTFVVPDQLVDTECRHAVANDEVKRAHLRLPPSLSDPELDEDNAGPTMARVFYRIRVSLKRDKGNDRGLMTISDKARKFKLVPAFEEQPPLNLEDCKEGYCLRNEKDVRKHIIMGKSGRIVMEAPQPSSLKLPPPTRSESYRPTTTVTIMLRYDPSEASAQPPILRELQTKLRVLTHFGATNSFDFPPNSLLAQDVAHGIYHEHPILSTRGLSGSSHVKWDKHPAGTDLKDISFRRGSTMDPSNILRCPSSSKKCKPDMPFYTTQLQIPVTLPEKKDLCPTFHQCFVSRMYCLDLKLDYTPAKGSGAPVGGMSGTPSVSLNLPIQISSQSDATGEELAESTAQHMAMTSRHPSEAGMDHFNDFFTPRNVAPPGDEYSSLRGSGSGDGMEDLPAPPPEYSFQPRAGGVLRAQGQDPWHSNVPGYCLIR